MGAAAKRLAPAPDADEQGDMPTEPENLNDAVVEIEWHGEVVGTVPKRRGRWPSKAGRLFEEDRYVSALRALLGEDTYTRIENEICPTIDDLNEFANHAGAVIARECVP